MFTYNATDKSTQYAWAGTEWLKTVQRLSKTQRNILIYTMSQKNCAIR